MKINRQIERDYQEQLWLTAPSLEDYVLEQYGWDLSTNLGGIRLKNPWGKAAGQLSLNTTQVDRDAQGGLGFVILKTVIAQDEQGSSVQSAWMVDAPRMLVEKITAQTGEQGWTVSWKGRGWSESFQSYLEFVETSFKLGVPKDCLIVPSCQLPLYRGPENPHAEEYAYTLGALGKVLQKADQPALELDLSPTLLKDGPPPCAQETAEQLHWVISETRQHLPDNIKLGLKLFNLQSFADQLALVQAGAQVWNQLDWLTLANRLFSPERGISYGGYDLSNRNLAVLDSIRSEEEESGEQILPPSISATGNICSGRMLVEYAIRGCTTGQLHTYFQLPKGEYGYDLGSRTLSALHELMFNPKEGLVASLEALRKQFGLEGELEFGKFFEKGGNK